MNQESSKNANQKNHNTMERLAKSNLIAVVLAFALVEILTVTSAHFFKNPVTETPPNYTNVYRHNDGHYYMAFHTGTTISVHKSASLSDWRLAERRLVYTLPPGSGYIGLGAPGIRFYRDNWYIYFQMQNEALTQYHTFVIKAENSYNPLGRYSKEIRLTPVTPEEGYDEVDCTILEYFDSHLYFIYSGYQNTTNKVRKLFIAPMSSPTTINGSRTLIGNTLGTWDKDGIVNPHLIFNNSRLFLAFTGHSAGIRSLGLMGIDKGQDPLVAENWWHRNESVFVGNEAENVWSPGYADFTLSPDSSENWMLYRASHTNATVGFQYTMRAQKFSWNEDGTPNFGKPVGLSTLLPQPSGEI